MFSCHWRIKYRYREKKVCFNHFSYYISTPFKSLCQQGFEGKPEMKSNIFIYIYSVILKSNFQQTEQLLLAATLQTFLIATPTLLLHQMNVVQQ